MYQFNRSFVDLLKRDRRYKAEAYAFVFETLEYAQKVLHLGQIAQNEPLPDELLAGNEELRELMEVEREIDAEPGHHITGQELCNAAREYAIEQYGFLAKTVLDSIGIRKTDDIGEIVYNLIAIGQMRKTSQDRREDFDDVFDFDTVFSEKYDIRNN